jgi:virginiamycin B lyase
MAVGSHNTIWFPDFLNNKLASFTTSGSVSEFAIPTSNSQTIEVAAGPGGTIWFTEFHANKIGEFNPKG